MDFFKIAETRQSCRSYNSEKQVGDETIKEVLESTILAPSACNSQPYHFTVCQNTMAKEVASECTGMGMNKFALDAPVIIVISEDEYNGTAALGARVKHNDYRSIDIGIAVAYLTARATELGLSSCILGWFNNDKIRQKCELKGDVRLVVALGYAADCDVIRKKKRKSFNELITIKGEIK